MNIVDFAKTELDLVLKDCEEDSIEMQKEMHKNILDVLEVLVKQKHSGFSIKYLMSMLNRLIDYRPLTPLTGKDDEWVVAIGIEVWQNIRCPSVFKRIINGEEKYYDLDAIMFCDPNSDVYYTSKQSIEYISFPYVPNTKKIKLHYPSEEVSIEKQLKDKTYTVINS